MQAHGPDQPDAAGIRAGGPVGTGRGRVVGDFPGVGGGGAGRDTGTVVVVVVVVVGSGGW